MIKYLLALTVISLFLAAGFFGVQKYTQTKKTTIPENLYKGKINVGYVAWPGYLALFAARDKGYFKEAGLDVEFKPYPSFGELSDAFSNGNLTAQATLVIEAVHQAHKGVSQKAILAIDHSAGSDGIIAQENIKTVGEIKGKKVAFEKDTLEEFLLRNALEQNSLTIEDIIPVDLNAEDSAEALVNKEVSAAVTYEPFMSEAVKKANGNLIYSTKNAPGLILDIVTFDTNFVKKYPETVRAFTKAYFKGLRLLKDKPEEAYLILAKELEVTPEEAKKQLEGVELKDENDNRAIFTFTAGLQSIYQNMRSINNFLTIAGKAGEGKIDTDKLVDPDFVKELTE